MARPKWKKEREKAKRHTVSLEDHLWSVCAAHGGASAILRQFAQDKIRETEQKQGDKTK